MQDWTALGYAPLIENLGSLTRLGAFDDALDGALAVARLIDRGRVLRSGLGLSELQRALDGYRRAEAWSPIPAIERALEQAIAIAAEARGTELRA